MGFVQVLSRVTKTLSACQQCWPESFSGWLMGVLYIMKYPYDLKSIRMIWKVYRWYEKCLVDVKNVLTFRMIWKVHGWSEKCPDDLKSAQMIWKVPRWSEKCPDDLKSARMIWKVHGWSEKCSDDLESVRMIYKGSRWSAKCLDDPEIVPMTRKMSRSCQMAMWGCWFWPRLVVGSGIVWFLVVALW